VKPAHRIALIDDDRTWLETLAEYLGDKEFQVRTALGGPRGLALLEERRDIGVAVVDFHMPELDGLELLRRLRRRRRNVDVLLMSSDDDPALPGRALREGAAAFLSKTMAPHLLLRALVRDLTRALAELGRRSPAFSPWDRYLPAPRRAEPWLPVPLGPGDEERN
jgi:DNA-binding NarL/FixJ family response regulator